jgi:4-amino-4-deoxychorismate lyase
VSSKLPSILINGQKTDQVSVLDRGFQYGDGLFETIHIVAGKPQYWQQHMERLSDGCIRLQIPVPELAVLQHEAESLYDEIAEGVLKITITRGQGGRGYAVGELAKSTRVLAIYPATQYPEKFWLEGVVVKICSTRLGINPALAGIKHLNRLEQVLARAEWSSAEIHEGLMLDINENVIEGTKSNVFCVKRGELYTPKLSLCGVKGIMREQVMNAAKQAGIVVHETQLDLTDLVQAEECFLCNSLIGVWPVRQLENHKFLVGPISQQLANILRGKEHGVEDVA